MCRDRQNCQVKTCILEEIKRTVTHVYPFQVLQWSSGNVVTGPACLKVSWVSPFALLMWNYVWWWVQVTIIRSYLSFQVILCGDDHFSWLVKGLSLRIQIHIWHTGSLLIIKISALKMYQKTIIDLYYIFCWVMYLHHPKCLQQFSVFPEKLIWPAALIHIHTTA